MTNQMCKARKVILYESKQRYTNFRRCFDIIVAIFFVLLPPLSGLLRFDFWGGRHYYGGVETTFTEVMNAFVLPFIVLNLIILIVSHQIGRYLCGWICPTGVMARWGEELESRLGQRSWRYRLIVLALSFVVATGGLLWIVDLNVYLSGSSLAVSVVALLHLSLTLAIYFEMTHLRFIFCKKLCPSGVYFAVLGQLSRTGITRTNRSGSPCKDCGVCDRVCPMSLNPRRLKDHIPESQGIYLNGMNSLSLCIRCGDCVAACDFVFRKESKPGVLVLGVNESFNEPGEKFYV
jgi:ferredoxin-type protein NapH